MPLPQDYVNYTRVLSVDDAGIKRPIYPTKHTQNPTNYFQNEEGGFELIAKGTFTESNTTIVLDNFYPEIRIGDAIFSTHNGANQYNLVASHTKVSGVSNITMTTVLPVTTSPSSLFSPLNDFSSQLTISSPGDKLRNKVEFFETDMNSGAVYASTTAGDNFIRFTDSSGAAVSSAVSGVKVGMVLTSSSFVPDTFPAGATVTAVSDNIVYFNYSAMLTQAIAGGINTPLFFSIETTDSETWNRYKSHVPSENNINDYQDYQNDIFWPNEGKRYGLDPQHAQINGSYYIDCKSGNIHFSSNLSGKTVILDYISDSLGTDEEMQVHKFAEEALYKCIIYGLISTRADIPEYVVRRYKKEKFSETRKAKLRLSNIKLEEITQILRSKSKQIKH